MNIKNYGKKEVHSFDFFENDEKKNLDIFRVKNKFLETLFNSEIINVINDINVFIYGTYIENIENLDNKYLLNLIDNNSDELYKILNNFQNNLTKTKELCKIIQDLKQRIEVLENK